MDNVIESEKAERDDVCGCEGGPTLSVLKDVQKAYEERIQVVHRVGGPKKLQVNLILFLTLDEDSLCIFVSVWLSVLIFFFGFERRLNRVVAISSCLFTF